MDRKITLGTHNAHDVLRSFCFIKVCTELAAMEYVNYQDLNLKSPLMHQKLKRANANIKEVSKHITDVFITPKPGTEEVTYKMHELMTLVMKLTEPQLDQFIKQLKIK